MTKDYAKIVLGSSEATLFIREHRATRPVNAGETSFGEVGTYSQPVMIVSASRARREASEHPMPILRKTWPITR